MHVEVIITYSIKVAVFPVLVSYLAFSQFIIIFKIIPQGPVKKITQHLKQVHKLPPHKVARLNTLENRRYATTKAIESKTPCPPRQQRTLEALLQQHPQPSMSVETSSPVPSQPDAERTVPPQSKGKGRKLVGSGRKGKGPLQSHTPESLLQRHPRPSTSVETSSPVPSQPDSSTSSI